MRDQNAPKAITEGTDASAAASPAVGTLAVQTAAAAGCQTYPPTSFQVCGAIRDKYNQMGGPTSFLLLPKSNELTNPGNTGKRSEFLGGNIYWSAATGAHPVAHEFLFKWGDHGYETGFLKYPKTDEIVLSDGVSRRQEFQGGHIYWSALTGAHSIQGLIYDKWKSLNAERGVLGFPTSDEIVAPDHTGRFHNFQNGAIYWHPNTGAHPVYGPIHAFWAWSGNETGAYGYPTGDPIYTGDNISQQFQHGTLRLWDGNLQGIRHLADDEEDITYYDTNVYPEYNINIDYSNYGITPDPDGTKTEQNRDSASLVAGYFEDSGKPVAHTLWSRLYSNMGLSYGLSTETVDAWMVDETNEYGDPEVLPPAVIRQENRDTAVELAIMMADQQNARVKVVVSPAGWKVTAGIQPDHIQSLGRYSMSAATAVIASPGPAGQHPIKLAQQAHLEDGYDFVRDDEGMGEPAKAAAAVAVDGFELGIAKWFFVYGDGSQVFWEGMR